MGVLGLAIGLFDGFFHEGGAVDAVGEFFFGGKLGVEYPDEGHAVWADEVEFLDCLMKIWVLFGEGCDVGVGGFYGVGFVAEGGFLEYPVYGGLVGDWVDW